MPNCTLSLSAFPAGAGCIFNAYVLFQQSTVQLLSYFICTLSSDFTSLIAPKFGYHCSQYFSREVGAQNRYQVYIYLVLLIIKSVVKSDISQ